MTPTGESPRRDHRHRCRLALRRRARALLAHVSRGCSAHARDHRLRRLAVPVHRRGAGSAGLDRRCAWRSRSERRGARGAQASGSEALFEAPRDCGDRRHARPGTTPGCAVGEPDAGVLIGAGAGGIDVGERQYYDFFSDGWKRVTPYAIPVSIVGMVSSEISIALELHGISHVVSTGCTSSTDAIGYAASLIRAGEADVLLTGGADACVTPGMIFGFSKMRAVSTPLQRSARRGVAPVRPRPRRLRARRRGVDDHARARGSRAGARRRDLRHASTATARPATPTTASRWIPTASRSSARCSWRSSAPDGRSRRSAT